VIEISERIVRKDISFIDPQRKFIETDLIKNYYSNKSYMSPLSATLVGITAKPNTKPSISNAFPHTPSIVKLKKVNLT
jgi:hypothetical protein